MNASLLTGFRTVATAHPETPALRIDRRTLTYGQMDQSARRLASAILNRLGRPAKRVGVFAYRSETAYVGTLAALYSGGAFVPLNRNFPIERTIEMARQAELDVVIVDASAAPLLKTLLEGLTTKPLVLLPETDFYDCPIESEAGVLDSYEIDQVEMRTSFPIGESDTAYLLFTSGSTGRPKGVPILHSNVLHYLRVCQERFHISPSDRVSQTFDQTFDLSVFDLFMAWSHGACLCVLQPLDLVSAFRAIAEMEISVWFSVPSVAMLLIKKNLLTPGSLPSLRLSLFCGEALSQTVAEGWQKAAPQSTVENLYGPTELTISCSSYRWDPVSSPKECVNSLVPIGNLHPGLRGLVLDENGASIPEGGIGELCVAGPQTFPGYLNAPELTKKAFWILGGEHYYRTGDLVRFVTGVGFVYLGRRDRQVKISGYRIELAEVEGVIKRCAGVVEAVVLPQIGLQKDQELIAFVIGRKLNKSDIEAELARTLPSYMRPKSIRILDALPLNANGKINVRALAESYSPLDSHTA